MPRCLIGRRQKLHMTARLSQCSRAPTSAPTTNNVAHLIFMCQLAIFRPLAALKGSGAIKAGTDTHEAYAKYLGFT